MYEYDRFHADGSFFAHALASRTAATVMSIFLVGSNAVHPDILYMIHITFLKRFADIPLSMPQRHLSLLEWHYNQYHHP